MHLEYKVTLTDHDFSTGEKHKLVPSVYAACLKKEGKVSYNGPTFISTRCGKDGKSRAETHSDDFERILQLEEFQDAAFMPNKYVKPLVFVSVDGGPDEAPKNLKTSESRPDCSKIMILMLYSSLPSHQAVVPIIQLKGEWHLYQRTLQVSFYPLILLEIT